MNYPIIHSIHHNFCWFEENIDQKILLSIPDVSNKLENSHIQGKITFTFVFVVVETFH